MDTDKPPHFIVVTAGRFESNPQCRAPFKSLKLAVTAVLSFRRAGTFARLWDNWKGEYLQVVDLDTDPGTTTKPDPA